MRKLFSYYGSKWKGANRYGPPRRDLLIEPFAGSACYATYYEHPNVKLYDLNEDVCAAWDWLIKCSDDDVRNVPNEFKTTEEWLALPDGPKQVVFWNIAYADKIIGKTLRTWYLRFVNGKPVDSMPAIYWNERVKQDIINAKRIINNWTIERKSYADIDTPEAHYFVDPPYQGKPGRAYKHNEIDFAHLAEWCRSLPGAVDVCENKGADWLPFRPLYSMSATNGYKQSVEVVWRNDTVDLFDIIGEQ